MLLSDLQEKDIIEVRTGNKIGNIIDVDISDDGFINKLLVYDKKGLFRNFNKQETNIVWKEVKKIGTDVILIDKE